MRRYEQNSKDRTRETRKGGEIVPRRRVYDIVTDFVNVSRAEQSTPGQATHLPVHNLLIMC